MDLGKSKWVVRVGEAASSSLETGGSSWRGDRETLQLERRQWAEVGGRQGVLDGGQVGGSSWSRGRVQ